MIRYGKLNSIDDEKEKDAYESARKYKEDIGEVITFILKLEFSVQTDYQEFWDFIK